MTAGQNIAQAKSSPVPTGLAILVAMVAVVGVFLAVSAMPHRAATAAAPAAVSAGSEARLEFLAQDSGLTDGSYATTADAARVQALYGEPSVSATTADAARVAALYGEQSWYASSADAARIQALYGQQDRYASSAAAARARALYRHASTAPQPLTGSSR